VATVWSQLRPTTRQLVERALQSTQPPTQGRNTPYDARADLELSKLLEALDEGVSETRILATRQETDKLRSVADTCAAVLLERTQSAEVFVQLIERAQLQHDYERVDALADALSSRFAPSEVCELARSPNIVVRALAQEALTQVATSVLIGMLHDPVDADVARTALQRQARDYGSEHARQIVSALEQIDLDAEEM
jgi:hypothetical protein